MSDIDLNAVLSGDASSFVRAVDDAVQVTQKYRDEQERAIGVGQAFEAALKAQGVSVGEWAQATKRAAEQAGELHGVTGQLAEALGHFGSVGKEAGEILGGLGDAGATAGAALLELVHVASEIGEFGNQLSNLHDKTALSVETLAQWSESAPVFGVSAETMATAIDRLAARVEMGNKQALQGLKELGITTQQFMEMNQQERYEAIVGGMTDIGEAGHKAAVSVELFSRAGLQLLPALTEEAQKYREMIEAVSGDTEEIARKGREWTEATNLLSVAWKQLEMAVVLPLFKMNAGMDTFGKYIADQIEQVPILGAALINFRNAIHAGDMPSFSGVKGGASTTSDQFFEETDKGTNAQAMAEEANRKYEEGQERKAASAQKLHDRLMKHAEDEQAAEDRKYEQVMKHHTEEENRVDAAWAKKVAQKHEDGLKAEIELTRQAAAAKEQSEAADTQFIQGFLASLKDTNAHAAKLSNTFNGIGQILSALPELMNALGVSSDSVAGKLASMGSSVMGSLGTIFDPKADIFSKITAGISGIASVVGGIISIFHKPEYKKAMEEVGRDWGVQISEGTAKAIEATESADHISRQMAELLNLDKIMGDAGGDPAAFGDKINNLLEAVASGAVPAGEGITQLGKAFTDLQTAAEGGSVASEAAMVKMIQRARELGEHIPELDAAVAKMLDDAMAGLDQFYKGLSPGAGGKSQGAASQTLFGAVYEASAGSLGLAATFDKFKDTFDDLKKSLAPGTKLTGGAAEFAQLEKLMKNEEFAGAARGAEGLAQTTKGLMDSGNLSQKVVDALSRSTDTLYAQALKGAQGAGLKGDKAEDAALKAILPELIQLQKAQEMGAKLTPAETALLAKANAEGLLPMKDIQTQQLETLRQIAANTGGGGGAGAGGGRPGDVHAAGGFFSPSMPTGPGAGGATGMSVHPGERVEVTPAGRNRSGGGTSVTVAPQLYVGTLIGDPDEVVQMFVRAANAAHPELVSAVKRITST